MFKIFQFLGIKPNASAIGQAVLHSLQSGAKPIDVLQVAVQTLLGSNIPVGYFFDLVKKLMASRQVTSMQMVSTDGRAQTVYALPQ